MPGDVIRTMMLLVLALTGCGGRAGLESPDAATASSDATVTAADGGFGSPCQCVNRDDAGTEINHPCDNNQTGCSEGSLCLSRRCTPKCDFSPNSCPQGYECQDGLIVGDNLPRTACVAKQ